MTTEVQRPTGQWIKCSDELPEVGTAVWTKIDDERGERNVQTLNRQGRLWFYPDGSMYVYYEPTHWQPIKQGRN